MNTLFVPSLGLDDSLIRRLAASVDYPIQWKCALNNGPLGALEAFSRDYPEWHIKETGLNHGVAGSWNQCAKWFSSEPCWLLMNEDAYFLPGYLEKICACMDANLDAPITHLNDSNAFYCFGWSQLSLERFGEFDENFWPAYCLSPETLVLKDDLHWARIDSLNPGDGLVGVEEFPPRFKERKYIPSTVTSSHRRVAPCVQLTFEDGREVVCSKDHKWLTKWPKPSGRTGILWKWRPAEWMHVGVRVYAPLRTWKYDPGFDEGWLSGIFDGEGCLHISEGMKGISFSQNQGIVLDHAKDILKRMGIHFTVTENSSKSPKLATVEISKKMFILETMGRLRPVRLFHKHPRFWENRYLRSKNVPSDLAVTKIEDVGLQPVITLETTSKTFIANGIVSHNCEDNDMRVRHRLAGVTTYPYALQGLPPLPHGKPRTGGVDYNAMLQGAGLLTRAYWRRKWGSDNRETAEYQTPYRDHRLTFRDVVWYPELRAQIYPLWDTFINRPNPSIYE